MSGGVESDFGGSKMRGKARLSVQCTASDIANRENLFKAARIRKVFHITLKASLSVSYLYLTILTNICKIDNYKVRSHLY